MVMDPLFDDLSFSADNLNCGSNIPLLDPKQSLDNANGFKSNDPAVAFDSSEVPRLSDGSDAFNNMPTTSVVDDLNGQLAFSAECDGVSFYPSVSPGKSLHVGQESLASSDNINSSDPVLRYISQMLMEENMEEKVCISPEDFALRNIEKSLYDELGVQYLELPDKFQNVDASQFISSSNSSPSRCCSKKRTSNAVIDSINSSNSTDPNWLQTLGDHNQTVASVIHPTDQEVTGLNLNSSSPFYASFLSNSIDGNNGLMLSPVQAKNICLDDDSLIQVKKVLEEASKFLPPGNQLVIDFENVSSGSAAKRGILEDTFNGTMGRKNREREDLGFKEVRASKQIASYVEPEEAGLSDLFDKVLLYTEKVEPVSATGNYLSTDASKDLHTSAQLHGSSGGRGRRRRRQGSTSLVDLRALLVMCAQAVYSNDFRAANELLKQIRDNSSPSGDGSQRLAHHFANGLEARMTGMTQSFYASLFSKRRSAADMLRAYQIQISSCPFMRLSIFYMNQIIWKLSHKATVVHIIDFGISFGFQFPILIQKLGERAGGPPKLRVTGIDLPQPGLRPAQRIEETGRRLARYCERFNVPFEYNALPSMNWEAIKIEDLKIKSGETIAVTCLMRLENLLDETVEDYSPRDGMLTLIRRIKPHVFVQAITNGSYNVPFFMRRFKEALFYMASIFDMFDTTISSEYKDSEARTVLESDIYGREIMNLIACEGPERMERPEQYKQWQVRHERAGFKQLPLDQAIIKELRRKLEVWYHKEFVMEEDGDWMLMGWRGRILYAMTSWVPI